MKMKINTLEKYQASCKQGIEEPEMFWANIANGILEARNQIEIPVPLVVRLTGTNENEAKTILAKNNINTFSTMREAVDEVVKLSK